MVHDTQLSAAHRAIRSCSYQSTEPDNQQAQQCCVNAAIICSQFDLVRYRIVDPIFKHVSSRLACCQRRGLINMTVDPAIS